MPTPIHIRFDCDFIKRAKNHYNFKKLNNSITDGASNIYGAMGELMVYDYFNRKMDVYYSGGMDYDIVINGYRVEVKTKRRTVDPDPFFNASVCLHNATQDCDFYMFCQVKENKSEGWILGYLGRQEFHDKAFILKAGELEGNFTVREDCKNVRHYELRPITV